MSKHVTSVITSLAVLVAACGPLDADVSLVVSAPVDGHGRDVTITGDRIVFASAGERAGFGLRTTSVGRTDGQIDLQLVRMSRRADGVAVLERATLDERLEGRADGLEQSWQLHSRPEGRGELTIDVTFDGVEPVMGAPGVVRLLDEEGGTQATYRDLSVVDERGHAVPSHLDVANDRVRIVIDDHDAVYPMIVDPLVTTGSVLLEPNDDDIAGHFGRAVSIDGDTVVVGKPGSVNEPAVAYVYQHVGEGWLLQDKLLEDEPLHDGFAVSVAVSGDTIVVGAPGSAMSSPVGAVYVFVRSGNVWSQQASLVPTHGACTEDFGAVVALSTDTVVVGPGCVAPFPDRRGEAYVFVRNGTTWTEQATLRSSDGSPGDGFSGVVATAGDTAIIGAPAYGYEGAAYVFSRTAGEWSQQMRLGQPHIGAISGFGASLSMTADRVVIGAPSSHALGWGDGAALVYRRDGGMWTQEAWLATIGPASSSYFGRSVGVSGDRIVVAAPNYGAYVFVRDGASWIEQPALKPPGGMDGVFGTAVAVSKQHVVVGDPGRSYDTGAAYVYELQLAPLAFACQSGSECASTFCVDGVCCGSACDGGDAMSCLACSVAAGAAADGTCSVAADGSLCGDSNTCVSASACVAGECVPSEPLPCVAPDQCHDVGVCFADLGECYSPPRPDGTPCDDGDPDTSDDVCTAGACFGVNHCLGVTCTPPDECHIADCQPPTGACLLLPAPDGTACPEGYCELGVCVVIESMDASQPDGELVVEPQPDAAPELDATVDVDPPAEASTDCAPDSRSELRVDIIAAHGGCGCRASSGSSGGNVWVALAWLLALASGLRRFSR